MKSKNLKPENTFSYYLLPVLAGAGFGLIAISVFVFGGEPEPEWPKNWQVKPLILTPVISAIGGLFFAFMEYSSTRGLNRILALTIGVIGFFVIFWLGMILGLNGTMWD